MKIEKDKFQDYDKELLEIITNKRKWPYFDNLDLILKLMRIANDQFDTKTVGGSLSSILIFQQIIEQYLINLIKMSNLLIQAKIWPNRINLVTNEKQMFGKILEEHKRIIDYTNKNELLKKCNEFNSIRIQFVHHLLKFKTDKEIIEYTGPIKDKFFEICDLFFTSREFFTTRLLELKDNEFLNKKMKI